jgi:teichoic acid transport system permease protein
MFKFLKEIYKEQIEHKDLIFRMAKFDVKATYQIHYLGTLWQFINPLIQVAIYYIVFGIGLRGGRPIEGDTPFLVWLLLGLIPWFFIAPTIIQGSNSIYQKVNLVSKMNFPVSVLPTIRMVGNSFQFLVLMCILFIVILIHGIFPSIYILQLPYYLICLYMFLFAFSILSSTIATLIRDYQTLLQQIMRMLLYLSPILWNPASEQVPDWLSNILKLNPFYYIIEGIRDSFLGGEWFFENYIYMMYFWVLTFVILYFGTKIHFRFRKNFVDYL